MKEATERQSLSYSQMNLDDSSGIMYISEINHF